MTRRLILALAPVIALYGPPSAAQMACGPRADIVRQLEDRYGEARQGMGLGGPASIFEVWVNLETGTWTILKTYTNGVACIFAAGDGWQGTGGENAGRKA